VTDGWDLIVRVDAPVDGDREGDDEALRRLRVELLELDIADAGLVPEDEIPPGAKSLSAIAGGLGVKLAVDALAAVVRRMWDWATRNGRTVEVTIDGDTLKLTGATAEQQERLVAAWLARHGAGR